MRPVFQWSAYIGAVVLLSVQITIACEPSGLTQFEPVGDPFCVYYLPECDPEGDYCYWQQCGWAEPCTGFDAHCVPQAECYDDPLCGEETEC
jgi:hypothetical protein